MIPAFFLIATIILWFVGHYNDLDNKYRNRIGQDKSNY